LAEARSIAAVDGHFPTDCRFPAERKLATSLGENLLAAHPTRAPACGPLAVEPSPHVS
jgi:hypothetical protein